MGQCRVTNYAKSPGSPQHSPSQSCRGAGEISGYVQVLLCRELPSWIHGQVVAMEMLSLKLPWFCFEAENEEVTKDSSFVPNEMLLNLFHGCLQHDLSDREVPMADADHVAFMEQVLQRDRDGHQPPFTLPVIRGKHHECGSRGSEVFQEPCFQVSSSAGVFQIGFSVLHFRRNPKNFWDPGAAGCFCILSCWQ